VRRGRKRDGAPPDPDCFVVGIERAFRLRPERRHAVDRNVVVRAGRVELVVSGDHLEREGCIVDRAAEHADLVK
jgi:hypothetical protein